MNEMGLPETAVEILVGEWLRRRELKLITAESCTGGLIGHRLTEVPGSSDYFLGSLVSYAYEAKQTWLGVRSETLAQYGAVSQEVVLEMAQGARQTMVSLYPLDRLIAVSVSGVAGPGGGSPEKPVGLVWIGMSAPGLQRAWRCQWEGNRSENKILSAERALQLLLQYLKGEIR